MTRNKASIAVITAIAASITLAPEQTYADAAFASIKAQADDTHVPLIVVYSNTGCRHCDLLKAIEPNGIYRSWLSSKGYTDAWFDDDEEVKLFARNTSGRYPFVAVYWNRGEGHDVVCERFSGIDGEMPVAHGTLMEQFMRSIDFAIFKADATCTNDSFSEAADFGSDGVSFGCNIGATAEDGERVTAAWPGATTTVWWKWTATEKCKVTFDTVGSDFDTIMGVYSGDSLNSLKTIAEDDDGALYGNASKIEFTASAGTTYYIAVSGNNGATGTIALNKATDFIPTFTYEILPEDNYLAGGAMITGADRVPARLEIPSEIDGYTVVAIAGNAFNYCQDLEEVVLPDTMVDVGRSAFAQCYELRNIAIPDSVTHLGDYAFYQCYGLESVSIGVGLKTIGKLAFGSCYSLESVALANGLESLGIAVFESCYSLKTITLPSSVTSINWQVFKNCLSLRTVYMHSSLKGLKNKAWFENSPNAAIQYYNSQTPAAPPQVEWIEATEDYEGVIEVRWDLDVNAEVSGYRLYRAMRPHFRFATMIAEMPASGYGEEMSYSDYDVSPQYTYCYWVVPVNDIFVGEVSSPATGYCDEVFAITTVQLPVGKELEPYSQALTVVGGNIETLEWNADGLPPGLSIAQTGIVGGVPIQVGTYTVRIGCHDSDWTMSAETELMIEIVENEDRKPEIRESTPADGSYLLLEPGANQAFSVSASDPDGKAVSYIWIVDGEEVGSGTDATSYAISTLGDEPGTRHDVACYVNDGPWSNIVCCKWTVYLPRTLYVDAAGGSDEADGASKEEALSTIQSAIDRSANGDTIIVADGVYAPIATRNRKIVIQSENGYKNAIIDGGGEANCALLGGPESIVEGDPEAYGELWQGTNTVLRGFTLRNGHAAWGAGVTAGTVENCLIVSNTVEAYHWNSSGPNGLGGGAYLSVLRNCTIVGNTSSPAISDEGEVYGGIDGGSCACTLFNCIEWGNADDVEEGAVVNNEWWQASVYENCCRDNPHFADAVNNDYRPSPESPAVVDGAVVAGCEFEIAPSTIPELTENEAAAWVSSDLATRYAVSGEDAADYIGRFEAKFGDDPVAALSKTTGKKDAQGNDMYVWQDYVAGTDPTDTNSVFTATIKMVDGKPVVEWSPKLSAEEAARRRYTIYGKAGLGAGEEWHSPTNALDRFFMVGVEMAD